jgi:hypothetical protein
MTHKVFICHSAKDKLVADAACAALEAHRIPCWIAPRDILAGEEYGAALIDALDECQIVLLIFSLNANNSPQVRREIERAVSKEKILVPYRIEDVLPSRAMEFALMNTHWLDALTPPMEHRLTELCDTITRLIQKHNPPTEPLWQPRATPASASLPASAMPHQTPSAPVPARPPMSDAPGKLEGSFRSFGRGNGGHLFRIACFNFGIACIVCGLGISNVFSGDHGFLYGAASSWFTLNALIFAVLATTRLRVYVPKTQSLIAAQRFWRPLWWAGLGKRTPADAFWSEDGGKAAISFVVADESWENPETVKKYQAYAAVAAGVIGSNPLICHLLDKNLVIRSTFTVSLQDGKWVPDAALIASVR